jgi:hypothetical protein
VAHYCRECKQRVGWDARACPVCGEENPLGREPGNLALMAIFGISTAGLIGWMVFRFAASLIGTIVNSN